MIKFTKCPTRTLKKHICYNPGNAGKRVTKVQVETVAEAWARRHRPATAS